MACCIELTCYKSGSKAAERCAYLMAACREPFSDKAYDSCINACKLFGKLDIVCAAEKAALCLRLVFPCNSEKVERINIPKTYVKKLILCSFH